MTDTHITARQTKRKTASQRLWFLHWLMASFYLLLFASGIYMTDLPKNVSYRGSFYDFHKTLGAIAMSLFLARIFVLLLVLQHKYRRRQPQRTREWWQTFAFHTAIYFFMLFVPLSGYLFSHWAGHPILIFGTNITLPSPIAKNQELVAIGRSTHFWLSYTFLAFVILHSVDQRKYLRSQLRRFSKAALRMLSSSRKRTQT